MNIQKALAELYEEKKRLDWTISTLEARLKNVTTPARGRRGRKSMNGDERLAVSKRMSSYWAGRRAAQRGGQETSEPVSVAESEPVCVESQPVFPNCEEPSQAPQSQGPQTQQVEEARISA